MNSLSRQIGNSEKGGQNQTPRLPRKMHETRTGQIDFKSLFGCNRSWLLALNVTQAGGLAAQATQIVQLGAPHFRGTDHFELIDHFGILGEDSLHTLAETDLANGEARLRAATPRNHHPFKRLHALFITLFDLHVYANGVAWDKLR